MSFHLPHTLIRILAVGAFLMTPFAALAAGVFASGALTVEPTHVVTCHIVNVGTKELSVLVEVVNVTTGTGVVQVDEALVLGPNEYGIATFTNGGTAADFFCRASTAKGLRGSMQVNSATEPLATLEMH